MRVKASYEHSPKPLAGQETSFWRKWGVDGMTEANEYLTTANCRILHKTKRANNNQAAMLVRKHELGHTEVYKNVLANTRNWKRSYEILAKNYDPWQAEVEAWIYGIGQHGNVLTDIKTATLMLDALNTYRRSLNVDDETWKDSIAVVLEETCDPATWPFLKNYTPLEPDPNDAPQQPCAISNDEWQEWQEAQEDSDEDSNSDESGPESDADPSQVPDANPEQNGPESERVDPRHMRVQEHYNAESKQWNLKQQADYCKLLDKGWTEHRAMAALGLDGAKMSPFAKAYTTMKGANR